MAWNEGEEKFHSESTLKPLMGNSGMGLPLGLAVGSIDLPFDDSAGKVFVGRFVGWYGREGSTTILYPARLCATSSEKQRFRLGGISSVHRIVRCCRPAIILNGRNAQPGSVA